MRKKWPTSGSLPSSSTRKITAAPCNRWRGVAGAAVVELAVPAHGVAAGAVAARVAAAAANRRGGAAGVKLNVGTRRRACYHFAIQPGSTKRNRAGMNMSCPFYFLLCFQPRRQGRSKISRSRPTAKKEISVLCHKHFVRLIQNIPQKSGAVWFP